MRDSLKHKEDEQDQEISVEFQRKPVRSETMRFQQRTEDLGRSGSVTMLPIPGPNYGPESQSPSTTVRGTIALERHCSVAELSKQWGFSENTIRRLFRKEPGVIKIVHQETLHKRGYTSMRIPERIAQRVHRRLQGIA